MTEAELKQTIIRHLKEFIAELSQYDLSFSERIDVECDPINLAVIDDMADWILLVHAQSYLCGVQDGLEKIKDRADVLLFEAHKDLMLLKHDGDQ